VIKQSRKARKRIAGDVTQSKVERVLLNIRGNIWDRPERPHACQTRPPDQGGPRHPTKTPATSQKTFWGECTTGRAGTLKEKRPGDENPESWRRKHEPRPVGNRSAPSSIKVENIGGLTTNAFVSELEKQQGENMIWRRNGEESTLKGTYWAPG